MKEEGTPKLWSLHLPIEHITRVQLVPLEDVIRKPVIDLANASDTLEIANCTKDLATAVGNAIVRRNSSPLVTLNQALNSQLTECKLDSRKNALMTSTLAIIQTAQDDPRISELLPPLPRPTYPDKTQAVKQIMHYLEEHPSDLQSKFSELVTHLVDATFDEDILTLDAYRGLDRYMARSQFFDPNPEDEVKAEILLSIALAVAEGLFPNEISKNQWTTLRTIQEVPGTKFTVSTTPAAKIQCKEGHLVTKSTGGELSWNLKQLAAYGLVVFNGVIGEGKTIWRAELTPKGEEFMQRYQPIESS